jgi:hypothetical protein
MEAKADRRHTADSEAAHKLDSKAGAKGSGTAEAYSLDQKFSDFAKNSPADSPGVSSDAKAAAGEKRRATEGCDAKLAPSSVSASRRGSGSACADSKACSEDEDEAVEREFEALMRAPAQGSPAIAANPKAREIASGFGM